MSANKDPAEPGLAPGFARQGPDPVGQAARSEALEIDKPEPLDCLIIGGGPAGLTAALYLGRYRRRVLLADRGDSRASWIKLSHNLPGHPQGVSGEGFLEALRAQADHYGVERRAGAVVGLRNGPDGLFYAEMDHHELCARTVLLATGVRENMPPLEHVAEAVRRGVVRLCPICDGYESSGLKVAVIGAGRHAAREALFLRTWAPQVTLLLQDEDLPDTTRSALAEAAVEVLPVGLGRVKIEAGRVSAEVSGQGPPRRFDVIYSAFGATPQTALAKSLGAKLDEDARLIVTDHQETTVDRLYGVGDIVRGLNQISVCAGEASVAATAIHNRLEARYA